jgi:hypothetical protein
MTISCFPASEAQIRLIAGKLKQIGLFERYGERVHRNRIQISVQTRGFTEREAVKSVLHEAGVTEFFYTDESAA